MIGYIGRLLLEVGFKLERTCKYEIFWKRTTDGFKKKDTCSHLFSVRQELEATLKIILPQNSDNSVQTLNASCRFYHVSNYVHWVAQRVPCSFQAIKPQAS